MAPVDNMFSTIFCAVPAFMRVEPVTTSAPTSTTIGNVGCYVKAGCSDCRSTATVVAPLLARIVRPLPTVYGVRPAGRDSNYDITSLLGLRLAMSARPASRESSSRFNRYAQCFHTAGNHELHDL